MNTELKYMLQSVLKEELSPINQRLDGIDKRFKEIDGRLNKVENRLNAMDKRLNRLETDIDELKRGQERLPKTIIENIGQFTENIVEHADDKAAALNDRVFSVETAIQRIYRLSS
ncbi:hypothetical protein K1I48_17840 [Bacillus licheniformis]|uniref:hypothetical protein n=1 Tax=Bacillus licheniformis TaxID=1402 RepID=UPI0005CE54EA|nr:hypothetical protein [Bacillus licheniformis]KJE31316.1 hypothetical protein LG49_823 [Bacillus licheniformis]MBW7635289.1 hypothetical protein [Bacillus licheniformis]OAZ61438.1 hypothetical protein SRCM100115_03595 [Bacillus licheniformis]TWM94899.1 hypothetical protein CHCC14596_1998 [Bacillus licheniformis]